MDSSLAYSLIAALGISVLSLSALAVAPKNWNHNLEQRLLGFAAGVLLATASLQLLPEAAELKGLTAFMAFLVGIVGFFILERAIGGLHSHKSEKRPKKAAGYFIIFGDGVHNLIDGAAIAIAFQISTEIGLATTLAVAAHEIPQEIADFVVLRTSGFSKSRALMVNFASALMALLGVVLVFSFGDFIKSYEGIALAVTAGIFLYIAAVDMIPELEHSHPSGNKYAIPLLVGVLLITFVTYRFPHEHEGEDSGTGIEVHETEEAHTE